jgi:hypothetical protein
MRTALIIVGIVVLLAILAGVGYFLSLSTPEPNFSENSASEAELAKANELWQLVNQDNPDSERINVLMQELVPAELIARQVYPSKFPLIFDLKLKVLLPYEMRVTYKTKITVDDTYTEEFFDGEFGYYITSGGSKSSLFDEYSSLSWVKRTERMAMDYGSPVHLWLSKGEHTLTYEIYLSAVREVAEANPQTEGRHQAGLMADKNYEQVWDTNITMETTFEVAEVQDLTNIIEKVPYTDPAPVLNLNVLQEGSSHSVNLPGTDTRISWPSIKITSQETQAPISAVLVFLDQENQAIQYGSIRICEPNFQSGTFYSANPFSQSKNLPTPGSYRLTVVVKSDPAVCLSEYASVDKYLDINQEQTLELVVSEAE